MTTATTRVLVVEDSATQAAALAVLLEREGCETIIARRAERALEMLGVEQVDIVLSDVIMPQMSGRHFADWLRKVSPHTKIVFVSGYLDESLQRVNKSDNGMFFLPKPFDPEQLAQTIRHALDS